MSFLHQAAYPLDVRVRELGADDGPLLRRFYSEVLERCFGPAELVSADALAAGVARGDVGRTLVMVAFGPGGEILGGIVGERYLGGKVFLLAYLGVRPDVRGKGVGTLLLAQADAHWYRTLRPQLTLGEVEHPMFHPSTDFGDPVARLRLYERTGSKVLRMPYFQPEVRKDGGRVYDMLLLALYADPSVCCLEDEGPRLAASLVGDFLDDYFGSSEGPDVVAGDPEYRLLRAWADRPDGIALLPLSRYQEIPRLDLPGRDNPLSMGW